MPATTIFCVFPSFAPLASFPSFEPIRCPTYRPDDRALRRHTLYPSIVFTRLRRANGPTRLSARVITWGFLLVFTRAVDLQGEQVKAETCVWQSKEEKKRTELRVIEQVVDHPPLESKS